MYEWPKFSQAPRPSSVKKIQKLAPFFNQKSLLLWILSLFPCILTNSLSLIFGNWIVSVGAGCTPVFGISQFFFRAHSVNVFFAISISSFIFWNYNIHLIWGFSSQTSWPKATIFLWSEALKYLYISVSVSWNLSKIACLSVLSGSDNLAIAGKYRDPCSKGFILVPNSRRGLL